MTLAEMKSLFEDIKREREENLPKYLEIMNEYFPDKMCSPFERFRRHGGWFGIDGYDDYSEEEWKRKFNEYNEFHNNDYSVNDFDDDFRDPQTGKFYVLFSYDMIWGENSDFPHKEFIQKFHGIMSTYESLKCAISSVNGSRYLDSEPLEFNNEDVLITDPCYVDKDDDWERCGYGSNMEVLGINHYLTRDTLYGDWSCTTFNTDTNEKLGEFCADAGLVSVFKYDEVKAYNPDIEKWCEEHTWCATIIKNFTGTVQIKVGFDHEYYDFYCYVEGKGSVNFKGCQTGF